MGHRERILEFIRQFPGRDDDEIATTLRISPRQSVNQSCRALALGGLIDRRPNEGGKLSNYPIQKGPDSSRNLSVKAERPPPSLAAPEEWYWEGNVVDRLARHLRSKGWEIVSIADAAARERGVDLRARRADELLLVEAKGFPTSHYRDPARVAERKPTNPKLQAQHWLSQALLKVLRLQAGHPGAIVAMAFPDFARYRTLVDEIRGALARLGLAVFFIGEAGDVETIGPWVD